MARILGFETLLERDCVREARKNEGKGRPDANAHGPSFLRWAGSKKKCLPQLAHAFDQRDLVYIEPFAGSAALFFSLKPQRAVLADLNGHLINALRHVRDRPHDVHARLTRLRRTSRAYYTNRNRFNSLAPHGIDSAVLFIYLNRNCFNGLWRTNQSGSFNVPYGGLEMGATPPVELFERCALALSRAALRHQDFRKTLSNVGEGAFIYADPPYFTASERTFVEYGRKSFGQEDLHDLISALKVAAHRGAQVVLTYNAAMPLDAIPKGWSRTQFDVTRNVGGFSGSRKKQSEVLYTNRNIVGLHS